MAMRDTWDKSRRGLAARAGSALLALLCAVALLVSVPACSSTEEAQGGEGTVTEAVEEEAGSLLLRVTAEGWGGGQIPVRVSGSQDDGEKINATLSVTPGEDLELTYAAGAYTFAIAGEDVASDSVVYADAEKDVEFDGSDDEIVLLEVPVDDEATDALAKKKVEEEAARAEAEAAARAQAEAEEAARAQAEAEAAAQAQAEAEAAAREQAEAEAAAQAQAETERNAQTVYITNTGEKYHNAGCRYLRQSKIPISLSDAVAQGYTPCKVCH